MNPYPAYKDSGVEWLGEVLGGFWNYKASFVIPKGMVEGRP